MSQDKLLGSCLRKIKWERVGRKKISQPQRRVNLCRRLSKTYIKFSGVGDVRGEGRNINVESGGYLKPKGADIRDF